eukprot:TRINITY_DN11873_c0_g1_i1.p1 TRINITY_DN11873_c0_g1~~TRINITY_DN11873_c0_g1_i1.p1  ORF type:complete len:450 (+),score=70.75 TRINITY_DN11873_c0_g1_i1:50-1399(+)
MLRSLVGSEMCIRDRNSLRQAKSTFRSIYAILMMVFVVLILGIGSGIFGIIYAKLKKSEGSVFFLNLSWILLLIILIFSLFTCLVLLPLTAASVDVCRTGEQALKDNTTLDNFPNLIRKELNSTFKRCFYDDGDILSEFRFGSEMKLVQNFSSLLDQTDQWKRKNTGNMTTLSINFVLQTIYDVLNFTSNPYKTTDNNDPTFVYNYFNSLTDSALSDNQQTSLSCKVTSDNWVFSTRTCKYKDIYLVNTPAAPRTLFGSSICLRFQDFDTSKLSQRYTSSDFSKCQKFVNNDTIDSRISSYYTSILNYVQDVNNVFSVMKTNIQDLATQDSQVWKNINLFLLSLKQYRSDMTNIFNLVSSRDYGLLTNSNCSSFRRDSEDVYLNICTNVMPMLAQVTFTLFAICILSMVTSSLMFLLKSRVYTPKKTERPESVENVPPIVTYGQLRNFD